MLARTRSAPPALPILVAAVLSLAGPAAAKKDFGPLKRLLGRWEGIATGDPGSGTVTREYKAVMNGTFIAFTSRAVFPPGEARPEGEVHEDAGYLSRDESRRRLVIRQFHSEGYVHEYLEEPGGDGKKVVFTTEAIENMPAGWRARQTLVFASDEEFVETYEVAAPGMPFTRYTETRFKRPGRSAKKHR